MLPQILLNAVIATSVYTLVGLSFALIYRVVRFFHFAHAGVFTAGAYAVLFLTTNSTIPFLLAAFLGTLASLILGCLMELGIYRPLRRGSATPVVLLVSSLGLYIVVQNCISLFFGDETRNIRPSDLVYTLELWGARITSIQLVTICTAIVIVALVVILVKKTRFGIAVRAVANSPELASIVGIDSDRVVLLSFALGSWLAGIAGILVALDVDMTPRMGLNALLMGVVAVIVGGLESVPGVVLGALLLGLAQHLGVWKIGSEWQDAIAFVVLLAFLLFKPEGFLGKKVRKAVV
jgi:branched-chain amino acid transport system permease protein